MPLNRKVRYGMVGGGPGAFIGAVHRKAAALDGEIELVAGAFSSDAMKSRRQGELLFLDPTRVYGSWHMDQLFHNFDRFGLVDVQSPFPYSGCGSAHYAPNSVEGYEYDNPNPVSSYCDDFFNYPNLKPPQQALKTITCSTWGCDELGYYRWFLQHMPKVSGRGPDGNWWVLADRTQARLRIIRFGALAATLIFAGVFWRQNFFWLIVIVAGYSFFWNAVHAQFEVVTLGHLGRHFRFYSRIRLWGSVGFIGAVAGLGFLFEHLALSWLPWLLLALLAGIWISSLAVKEPAAAAGAALRRPM